MHNSQISAFIVNHKDDICIDKKEICDMVALHNISNSSWEYRYTFIYFTYFVFIFKFEDKQPFQTKRHEYNWINRIVKCD